MHPIHKRILGFFALSCALTWVENLCNLIWPSDWWSVPMNPFGPLVAALIFIPLTEGRDGLRTWWRRITRFRAPLQVYAASFLIPLFIIAMAFGATVASGASLASLPDYHWTEVLLMTALVPFFGPIPEELSFRGYGLERLQQTISPLAASLWIGFGVIVWHVPLMLTGNLPVTVLLPLAGVAVVYGWLYRNGQSVWPLVILHGQVNVCSALVIGPMMPGSADQAVYLAFLGLFYIGWAAWIIFRCGSTLTRRPADPGLPMPV
ncbi:MAG: CPBP family intramembrane metalloprotease [Rhodobacteraceae bacterium]|nr:CPBP family intramembrane metalloprotease [Paracoccaceae bacterium]